MAITQSTEIFNTIKVDKLVVVPIFKDLMEACVSDKSIYNTAKKTIDVMFEKNQFNNTMRAKVLTDTYTNVITTLTQEAMKSAILIATENLANPYRFAKTKADTLLAQEQANLLSAQNLQIPIQIELDRARIDLEKKKLLMEQAKIDAEEQRRKLMVIQGWKIQAEMIREDGFNRDAIPNISQITLSPNSVVEQGTKYEQGEQAKLSSYAVMAKAYRESGVVHWTNNSAGRVNNVTDYTPSSSGLTKAQELVAKRQLIAFEDNKTQHAVNSSANMIGIVLTAEEGSVLKPEDVTRWRTAIDRLNTPAPTVT